MKVADEKLLYLERQVPGDGIYKGTASHACGARKIYQNTVA
jgi:hypothetical protein